MSRLRACKYFKGAAWTPLWKSQSNNLLMLLQLRCRSVLFFQIFWIDNLERKLISQQLWTVASTAQQRVGGGPDSRAALPFRTAQFTEQNRYEARLCVSGRGTDIKNSLEDGRRCHIEYVADCTDDREQSAVRRRWSSSKRHPADLSIGQEEREEDPNMLEIHI